MGLIQRLFKNSGGNKEEFKRRFREAQEEQRINNLVSERQKSSNRRELERFYREQEEEQIKNELTKIRKQRDKENWKSKNMVLSGKATMLKTDRPILKEKNIFKNSNDNPLTKEKEMFFRW